MSEYLMEMVGYEVQSTADWRREKAAQFPHDAARNLRAAEELDRLAAQIEQVNGDEDIHQQIEDLHDLINKTRDDDIWADVAGDVSAELRAIGFHNGYTTALDFLSWYRDLLQQKLHEEFDSAINEQVDDDPAVQAAEQALAAVRAKTRAEILRRRRVIPLKS